MGIASATLFVYFGFAVAMQFGSDDLRVASFLSAWLLSTLGSAILLVQLRLNRHRTRSWWWGAYICLGETALYFVLLFRVVLQAEGFR